MPALGREDLLGSHTDHSVGNSWRCEIERGNPDLDAVLVGQFEFHGAHVLHAIGNALAEHIVEGIDMRGAEVVEELYIYIYMNIIKVGLEKITWKVAQQFPHKCVLPHSWLAAHS